MCTICSKYLSQHLSSPSSLAIVELCLIVFIFFLCQSVLDISDINCVFEGDLVEVDPETFLPRFKVHAFLLHDSMVIASIIQNRYVQLTVSL